MKACDGCGATGELVDLEDSEHRTLARVCRGRPYTPKPACVRAAIEKHEPTCVVCGEELRFSGRQLRPVCKACEGTIAQLRDQKDLKWYRFKVFDAFSRDVPGRGDYQALGDAFRRVLCGDARATSVHPSEDLTFGRSRTGYDSFSTADIWARLSTAQADGVVAFVEAFKAFALELDKHAREEGGALLVKLARGEVSIDDFNDGRPPKR